MKQSVFSVAAEAVDGFNRGWRDEDDDILPIGKHKPKDQAKSAKRARRGASAWQIAPNWDRPSPLVDAPPSERGVSTVHLKMSRVNVDAVPIHEGRPLFPVNRGSARANAQYCEREGAAEKSYAVYVEDPEKAEESGRSLCMQNLEEPLSTQTSADALAAPVKELRVSVFSNISEEQRVRFGLWDAYYRTERRCRRGFLEFDVDSDPDWWRDLDPILDVEFKLDRHMHRIQRELLKHDRDPNPEKKPYSPPRLEVSLKDAGRMLVQLSLLSDRPEEPIAGFRPGPSGRIQYRIVASLPHELTPEDRAEIAQELCALLPKGVMYTCVVHAPDAHNDARNYHLHLIFSDRPARYLEEQGCWDFEYREVTLTGRHAGRVRFSKRQPKIAAISQRVEGIDWSGPNFIPSLRSGYVDILNRALEKRGSPRRYDARSLQKRRIAATPTRPLGTSGTTLERAGVATPTGDFNAKVIFRRIEQAKLASINSWARPIERALSDATTAIDERPEHPDALRVAKHRDEIEAELRRIVELMREKARFQLAEQKARSRPERVAKTCKTYLDEIAAGTASNGTRRQAEAIAARAVDADRRLCAIDATLSTFKEDVKEAEAALRHASARLIAGSLQLQGLARALRAAPEPALAVSALAAAPAPTPVTPVVAAEETAVHEPGSDEPLITTLTRLIHLSAEGEGYVTLIDDRPATAIDNVGLAETLLEFADEPRVTAAVSQLRLHLTCCSKVTALIETPPPYLDGLGPEDRERVRRAAAGSPRTLFASRDEKDVACLCTTDDALAELLERVRRTRDGDNFLDALHFLLRERGEEPLRGRVIDLPPPFAGFGAGRGWER